jgi:2-dehydro-3-deoxyphosphogluconate aldolase / (4S)-4-hydroxy-2-oxoglutarate aldolase
VQVKYELEETTQRLIQLRIIGIVRLGDVDSVVEASKAAAAQGLLALEVPFTVPGAGSAISILRASLGSDAIVGAGTVRTRRDLESAVAAGCRFVVAPGLNKDLIRLALKLGVLIVPGVFTASEVDQALSSGCTLLKLFPALPSGPDYMAALQSPFPEARFVPTGGVGPGNASAFLEAGAAALGMGSSVFPPRRIEREGVGIVGSLAASALAAVRA